MIIYINKQSKIAKKIGNIKIDLYTTTIKCQNKVFNMWTASLKSLQEGLNGASSCKILILDNGNIKELNLPTHFATRLIKYLRFQYRKEDGNHECGNFVMYMLGLPVISDEKNEYHRYYDSYTHVTSHPITNFDNLNFIEGTPLMLRKNVTKGNETISYFVHYMIYVGQGLYLSKIGTLGLGFGDIKSILKIYDANNIYPIIDIVDRNICDPIYDNSSSYLFNNDFYPEYWWNPRSPQELGHGYVFSPPHHSYSIYNRKFNRVFYILFIIILLLLVDKTYNLNL